MMDWIDNNFNILVCIWVIISFLLAAIGVFCVGYSEERSSSEEFLFIAVVSIIWPFIFFIGLINAPFIGVYYLGIFLRKGKFNE